MKIVLNIFHFSDDEPEEELEGITEEDIRKVEESLIDNGVEE